MDEASRTPRSIRVLMPDPAQYLEIAQAARSAGMKPSVWLRYLGLKAARTMPKTRAPKARLEADRLERP